MKMEHFIQVLGARTHNLKNINCTIPLGRITVITGISGSGKSSLAFDTLFAEGQRRYTESLSTYARQFLERMQRPDVDLISNIPPAIAVEQQNKVKNARSTVGTTSEINDYLQLLFASVGKTICPECQIEVKSYTPQSAALELAQLPMNSSLTVLAALERENGTSVQSLKEELIRAGFFRILIKGEARDLSLLDDRFIENQEPLLILIDRLRLQQEELDRLADSLEVAFQLGKGKAKVMVKDGKAFEFDTSFSCPDCKKIFKQPEPNLFSFNSPIGACSVCHGFGKIIGIDVDKIIPNKNTSLRQGAIVPWNSSAYEEMYDDLELIARRYKLPLDIPFGKLTEEQKKIVVEGIDEYIGIRGFFRYLEKKRYKMHIRVFLSRYRSFEVCPHCKGSRLKPEALNVVVNKKNIQQLSTMSIEEVQAFFANISFSEKEEEKAYRLLQEIKQRVSYLHDVGLGYIDLNRQMRTLSGGEAQRINLAAALGSALTNTLYILDEPTIGLHPCDSDRLLSVLRQLKERGNTLVIVEHDPAVIQAADKIIDLGPDAGEQGGEVIFQGNAEEILESPVSLTGKFLRGEKKIHHSPRFRKPSGHINIFGARENNLKNIDVKIPLGVLACLTGVSGSGKSTLMENILYAGYKHPFGATKIEPGRFERIEGTEQVDDILMIDQSPLNASLRSNPATYIKAYDEIRNIMANTRAARLRGIKPAHFSFNVPGGRCPLCKGTGFVTIEMFFLADISLVCEQCQGKRFTDEILDIKFRGKNIDDILNMTVSQAMRFFEDFPRVAKRLQALIDLGLGYLKLGQSTSKLSGGEAQRIKLVGLLAKNRRNRKYLFLFDEPTTGLHLADIEVLLQVLQKVVDEGNSVLVIEHNPDFIAQADYIIDLGPGGGDAGGRIVAQGTVEDICNAENSITGKYLKKRLIYLRENKQTNKIIN
jgi:excinuclease ABC subunit A